MVKKTNPGMSSIFLNASFNKRNHLILVNPNLSYFYNNNLFRTEQGVSRIISIALEIRVLK